MIEIGQTAKDRITGFEGVVIGRAVYVTGCIQIQLQPEACSGSSGSGFVEPRWFDEDRLGVSRDTNPKDWIV